VGKRLRPSWSYFEEGGVDQTTSEDLDIRLSVHCQIRFLNLAAMALRGELRGFRFFQPMAGSEKCGLLYYTAVSSGTVGLAARERQSQSKLLLPGMGLAPMNERRLTLAGLTFIEALNDLRRDLATQCLANRIVDIRKSLGFSVIKGGARVCHLADWSGALPDWLDAFP
jgi:hypothetical protein